MQQHIENPKRYEPVVHPDTAHQPKGEAGDWKQTQRKPETGDGTFILDANDGAEHNPFDHPGTGHA